MKGNPKTQNIAWRMENNLKDMKANKTQVFFQSTLVYYVHTYIYTHNTEALSREI